MPLVAILLLASWGQVLSQGAESQGRFIQQVGIEANLSRVEGDAPSWVRQNANDFSTNFGTKATFSRIWSPGFGVYGTTTCVLLDFLGLDLGFRVGTYTTKESYEVSYDPPSGLGVSHALNTLRNTYLNFSPSIAARGRWKRISLCLGLEANLFILGRTTTFERYTTTAGETSRTEETRLDTQDQPVYLDPLHFGGIADYTSVTNRNHGANPVWFSTFARVDYKLLRRKGSPVMGFTWRLPLMELLRSQNPYWSFIHGVDPDFEKMNYGTRISTMALHLGWSF